MFTLPDLPYPYEALEPAMSAETLRFHHDKHHGAYVKAVNELLDAQGKAPPSLEALIRSSAEGHDAKLYNNAAQAWNHGFFWQAMTSGANLPSTALAKVIGLAFGGHDKLREAFVKEGVAHFGSGWVWLIATPEGAVAVKSTHDAHDFATEAGETPLLVCDLWEHAYYLDFRNDRKAYLEAWFDVLANWDLASDQWAATRGEGKLWSYPLPTESAAANAA
jgi:Fe-Mn family superoxide dismutase